MSRSLNALRFILIPTAKIKEFSSTSQSLKFKIMENLIEKNGHRYQEKIIEHGEENEKVVERICPK